MSNRHMTWWHNAWWVRVNNGPHLRTARDRRRVWRAATNHTCGRRETVEEYGEQPPTTPADGARPSKSMASSHQGRAGSAPHGKGRREREKGMGEGGDRKKRKQHVCTLCCTCNQQQQHQQQQQFLYTKSLSHDLLPQCVRGDCRHEGQPFIARDRFVAGLPVGAHQRVLQ